jgi:hypothetical protein
MYILRMNIMKKLLEFCLKCGNNNLLCSGLYNIILNIHKQYKNNIISIKIKIN